VIHQDVTVYATRLSGGHTVTHALADGRHAWVQVATGHAAVNGTPLAEGDGAGIQRERATVTITSLTGAELLVFDLP
jgi:redox-sensitive bicupin YhaK (pirin superfamily)